MKRVLLITYYFPPSGGPGVQRVLKFAKYLPAAGWQPAVLTVADGAFPERDAALHHDVAPDLAIHRTTSWDPFQWYARLVGRPPEQAARLGSVQGASDWKERLAAWVRANVFLPDARVGWVPFAVAEGRRLLAGEGFDAILTSGPPHSTHLTGWLLHRQTGVPWLADFRDPWTDINYYHELPHTALARRLDAALERGVLRHASAVTTVSPSWQRLLAARTPDRPDAVHVVQNGFDVDDFVASAGVESEADRFTLTYVGSLYASRNPVVVWQALRRLREEGSLPRFRLRLVGKVDPVVRASLTEAGLDDVVEEPGYRPHDEAVAWMRRSHLLLLVVEAFPHNAGMITGKLYEYLASGRPVLGIGPVQGDAAALLRATGGGEMMGYAERDRVAACVRAHYEAWAAGRPPAGAPPEALRPFTRRRQTERLADVLDRLVGAPEAPPAARNGVHG
ncbi:group 1 glycosyl transferase [Rhodothermaceae bacterium RA]|nr:group 1 glycosyl transferase [Rhodothermaceae bacterium RA]